MAYDLRNKKTVQNSALMALVRAFSPTALVPAVLGLLLLSTIPSGAGVFALVNYLRACGRWGVAQGRSISRRISGRLLQVDVKDGRSLRRQMVGCITTCILLRMAWRLRAALRGFDPSLRMNDHEDTLDAALQTQLAMVDWPVWGPGFPETVPSGIWKPYLHGHKTASENLEDIHVSLGLVQRRASEMTLDQLAEGVRRLMFFKFPDQVASGHYWNEEEARRIAQALAEDCGLSHPLSRGGMEECVPVHLPKYIPWPTLTWLDLLQRNALGFLRMFLHVFCSFHSSFIETPYGRMHILDSRPEAQICHENPPLLVQHGMFVTGWSMALLGWLLSANRRVVIPDLFDYEYGWSRSEGCKNGKPLRSLTEHTESLLSVVRYLSGPGKEPVDLCGHSFGGLLVASLAKICGERGLPIRKVVLLGPGGNACKPGGGSPQFTRILNAPKETLDESLPRWIPRTPVNALFGWVMGVLCNANNCNTLLGISYEEVSGITSEWTEPKGVCTVCPTLLLWGDQDVVACPRRPEQLGQFLHATLPNLDAFWVEGGQHNIQLDSVMAVASSIDSWLDPKRSNSGIVGNQIIRALFSWTHRNLRRMDFKTGDVSKPSGHATATMRSKL